MNQIQNTQVQTALARAFGLRDRTIVETVEQSIQPVALVRDLTHGADPREIRFAAGNALANAVGAIPYVQLYNPVGSNITVLLHKIWLDCNNTTSQLFFLYIQAAAQATNLIGQAAFRNTFVDGFPIGQMRGGIIAPAGNEPQVWGQVVSGQNVPFPLALEFVLKPGRGLTVTTNTVTSVVQASFEWEETPLDPSF